MNIKQNRQKQCYKLHSAKSCLKTYYINSKQILNIFIKTRIF